MTSISDTNVVNAPGGLVELAYAKINTSVVLGTSSGVVISPVTVVCDGSPILVEFFAVMTTVGSGAGSYGITQLMVDGAVTGRMTQSYTASAIGTIHFGGCYGSQRLTPSAGVHTFGINGYRSSAASAEINAGSGVGDDYPPAFIRISKIIQASQLIVQTPNAPLVTSLPSNAIDGQEVRYLADNTNGIIWNFRYRAGSSSTYKWEFIGGPALRSSVASVGRQTNLNVFENLNGPTITVPLAGDYDLVAETGWNDAYDSVYLMQILAGSTGIQTARMRQIAYGGGEVVLTSRALAIAASTLIRPQYYIQVAQAVGYGWGASSIAATPIRVSA